jgi:hypothetical protein
MADLSPAAQAVIDAFIDSAFFEDRDRIAAVLRAAADEAAKSDPLGDSLEDSIRGAEREHMRGKMYAIAAKLEGQVKETERPPLECDGPLARD